MAGTQLTPLGTFQDVLAERIRNDIGSLIPDEALAGLVEAQIEKAFFEGEKRSDGYRVTEHEPVAFKMLRNELSEKVEARVKAWFAENPDKVEALLEKAFEGGLITAVTNAFQSRFGWTMDQMVQDALNRLGR